VGADELVALVDDSGVVIGSAPRSVVRRDNLRHGATGVLVRNAAGDVYVHRRTETKDVFPGAHDCWAGGVLLAGEDPLAGAERELAEELGVTGVPLVAIGVEPYEDEVTRYVGHLYQIRYEGRFRHQPEEVAWGGWMTLDELRRRLADPGWPFVPDGRAFLETWLRTQP